MDDRGAATPGRVELLLVVHHQGTVSAGRVDGTDQAVLSGVRDRDDWLPRWSANDRRDAGRRSLHHQRRRRRLGGGDRCRLLCDEPSALAFVLMTTDTRSHAVLERHVADGSPAIEVKHLSLAFDDKVILRDVSFTLERGDTKAILGAGGPGKTNILTLIG